MRDTEHAMPSISVIICAYTEQRWRFLVDAVDSVRRQTLPPAEVVVVIDNNPGLLLRARAELPPDVRVIANTHASGAGGARNSGVAATHGAIVAFLDDDAIAEPDWIEQLIAGYTSPEVAAVGGKAVPIWLSGKPAWFPDEFLWVVGCSYRGMPETIAPVRNLFTCNMSCRREILASVDGFRAGVGHSGGQPNGDDDTELCIRIRRRWPAKTLIHRPQAIVRHHVPAGRATLGYFRLRCYLEGRSKSILTRLHGVQNSLSVESAYTMRTLPLGILRGIRDALGGDRSGPVRAGAIMLGLAATTTGYLIGVVEQLIVKRAGGRLPV